MKKITNVMLVGFSALFTESQQKVKLKKEAYKTLSEDSNLLSLKVYIESLNPDPLIFS